MKARGSAINTLTGVQDGVRPHPVDPFAHQVDPGVVVYPVLCCLMDPSHHDLFPFVNPNIDIFRFFEIGGSLNLR